VSAHPLSNRAVPAKSDAAIFLIASKSMRYKSLQGTRNMTAPCWHAGHVCFGASGPSWIYPQFLQCHFNFAFLPENRAFLLRFFQAELLPFLWNWLHLAYLCERFRNFRESFFFRYFCKSGIKCAPFQLFPFSTAKRLSAVTPMTPAGYFRLFTSPPGDA